MLKKGREKQQWAVESRELVKFGQQIDLLGLVLKDVKGDGNCLFRCVIAAAAVFVNPAGDQLD